MNALWRALYAKFAILTGEHEAYTLTGGQMYRGLAAKNATLPYIVINLTSNDILRCFGSARIEQNKVRISVVDKPDEDATGAWKIWDSLQSALEDKTLTFGDESTSINVMREDGPNEEIADDAVIISGAWVIEREFT